MALLTITVVALLLMTGILTPKKASARIGLLVLSLLLMPLLSGVALSYWNSAGLITKFLIVILGIPAALLYLVRTVFGREVYHHLAADVLYDLLRSIFRGIGRMLRSMFYTRRTPDHR